MSIFKNFYKYVSDRNDVASEGSTANEDNKSFIQVLKDKLEGSSSKSNHSENSSGKKFEPSSVKQASEGSYAVIKNVVSLAFESFLRKNYIDHIEIEPDDLFALTAIRLQPTSSTLDVAERFFREFNSKSRISWINKLLEQSSASDKITLHQFQGFEINKPTGENLVSSVDGSSTVADQTEFWLDQQSGVESCEFRLQLVGRWIARELLPRSTSLAPKSTSNIPVEDSIAGVSILLRIEDALTKLGESRTVRLNRYPAIIGLSTDCDIPISATYASSRHLRLDWKQGEGILATDLGSTNGTFVSGQRIDANSPIRIKDGMYIQLSDSEKEGALITVRIGTPVVPVAAAGWTSTLATPVLSPTPIAKSNLSPIRALAFIEIEDVEGSKRVPVHKLPFRIGRSSGSDYVAPSGNGSVSGDHMVLVRLLPTGFEMRHPGAERNGTTLKSKKLGESFVWKFSTELTLGGRNPDFPTCKLVLHSAN